MIAKCVAILAVVAQINAYVCNSNCASPVVSGCGSTSRIVGSSGIVGSTGVVGSAIASRNIVARNKYPVALDNCGPVPDPRVPVTTSHVSAPVQEKPTVRLPATIPAPRTVAHSCTCYKTIVRPRVHDQYITVPTVQRYIETTHNPVVENIQYEAIPVNCQNNCAYSAGLEAVPVAATTGTLCGGMGASSLASSCVAVPVASSLQVASAVPATTYATGLSGCGSQTCCY